MEKRLFKSYAISSEAKLLESDKRITIATFQWLSFRNRPSVIVRKRVYWETTNFKLNSDFPMKEQKKTRGLFNSYAISQEAIRNRPSVVVRKRVYWEATNINSNSDFPMKEQKKTRELFNSYAISQEAIRNRHSVIRGKSKKTRGLFSK